MVAEYQEAHTQDNVVKQGMVGIKAARIGDYKVLAASLEHPLSPS